MAKTQADKEYKKEMGYWGRASAQWQLDHPDLDLIEELWKDKQSGATTNVEGGDRPPQPPIKP